MFAAVLTAFFYTLSAVFSQRTAKRFGALEVNCLRLAIATAVLGIITAIVDSASGRSSLHPEVYAALFVSGLIGFGLGDVGLFLAYTRLGSRRTLLINWCAATMTGALTDWILLRDSLTISQGLCVLSILAGLVTVLLPARNAAGPSLLPVAGVLFAIMAGVGQGVGTTLSRQANDIARSCGMELHGIGGGISQAFQRASAGVLFAGIVLLLVRYAKSKASASGPPAEAPPKPGKADKMKNAGCWLAGTALWGPVIGVSCYQWALQTEKSPVVLAVAATSTLLIIPLARVVEKDRAGNRQIVGSLLAAAGVIGLCLLRVAR